MSGDNVTRREFLYKTGLSVAAGMFMMNLRCNKSVKRPNILWVTCEDMSPRLGCYGDSLARTPNIDKLAAEGVLYTKVYSVSGVCAPSRCALITGMYPTTIGAQHMRTLKRTAAIDKVTDPEALAIPVYEAVPPPEVKCFTEYLRAEGYYCTNNVKTDYQFHTPITAWDECSKKAHWRNRPDNLPFFSVFNFTTTHESQIWKRANDPLFTDPNQVILPPYYPESPVIRRDMARQYDNIAIMDSQVGELLKQLDEDGLTENTIIFFYSDHGSCLPRCKRWLYDGGTRVPLIIRYPNKENGGEVVDDLISFVDFAPTMLSLLDIEIPKYMQGEAFLGKQKAKPRQYIYAAKDRMDPAIDCQRAVRDKRFKYIRNYLREKPYVQFIPYRDQMDLMKELHRFNKENKLNDIQKLFFRKTKPAEELYDLENDPYEVKNLAENPEFEDDLTRLRTAHVKWKQETRDIGLLPEKELVKNMWPPDAIQPQTEKVTFKIKKGNLSLSCSTEGASIAYRIKSGKETKHWNLYTRSVKLEKRATIKAVAIRIGFKQSEESSYVFK